MKISYFMAHLFDFGRKFAFFSPVSLLIVVYVAV